MANTVTSNNREHYDIIVIGSGPGGQKAAVGAAKAGKKVALLEMERSVGGSCLYQGTIPSKTLREAALTILKVRQNAGVIEYKIKEGMEVATLMDHLDKVLQAHQRFIDQYLVDNNIHHHHGRAKLLSPTEVQLDTVKRERLLFTCENIIIATGSRPRNPPNIPIDHEHILDSDSILSMLYLPRSLAVIGGGVIGSEYASIFSMLGVDVTLIDKAPRPLMFMESELTDGFLRHFKYYGGKYMGEQMVETAHWDGTSAVETHLQGGTVIKSDELLVCQGRMANVERLGVQELGMEQGKYGHITVNEHYQSSIPNIYAVGDVIGPPALASSSMEQGRRAVCHALDRDPGQPFEFVPMGIYAVPELASVGLTEEQAQEKYGEENVVVGRAGFDEVSRSLIAAEDDGLLKLVALREEPHTLVGVQSYGPSATDLIHVGEMGLINHNSVRIFQENVMNFPTMGESYRIAALNLLNKL